MAGYPGEANVYEVGDTPGVRAKIATGELVEVDRPRRSGPTEAERRAAQQRIAEEESERLAAEQAEQAAAAASRSTTRRR